jgi:hypothetical protein
MRKGLVNLNLALGLIVLVIVARGVPSAQAGEFRVATCQADSLGYTADAFSDFASRGMVIKKACNPEGAGLRGVITTNAVGKDRIPRLSQAFATLDAPPGTTFTKFRWAGSVRRLDCLYAISLYADGPTIKPIPIKTLPANQDCSDPAAAKDAGYNAATYNVPGATRIVQRVVCVGGQGYKSCSAGVANYIRTYKATVSIVDSLAPAAQVSPDLPLGRGDWVGGTQPLDYDATDNVGVRSAQALVGNATGGSQQRPCALATSDGAYRDEVPCENGQGQIAVDTHRFPEGTQQLVVQAQDTAGNLGSSAAATVHIDNMPPDRVDVAAEGGEAWRNQNGFAADWTNPPEPDRAPIAGVQYKLCPKSGGDCTTAALAGADISRLPIQVPAPGEWTLSLWRSDAANNQTETAASVPVTLRYDPEPPQVAFEVPSASDPTRVAAQVTDRVSGLAGGAIEISKAGSSVWTELPTQQVGSELVTRIDDATMAQGDYALRARAFDQAQNESSTDRRLDGQPMVVSLPLRIVSTLRAGIVRYRVVRQVFRRGRKSRVVRRRVSILKAGARVPFGSRVRMTGTLKNSDGQGIQGAAINVYSRSPISPERLVGVVHTTASGRYHYTAKASRSSTLRFFFAGSPLVIPTQSSVSMSVPSVSSLSVSRTHVLNGQAVRFAGRVRALPVPPAGKLVELQVLLSGAWQTFRTAQTDRRGGWTVAYRFKRTRGLQRFRFRVRLPAEDGYPFATGKSRSITVQVRGR